VFYGCQRHATAILNIGSFDVLDIIGGRMTARKWGVEAQLQTSQFWSRGEITMLFSTNAYFCSMSFAQTVVTDLNEVK
jgi:hypothetical protein